MVSNCHGSWDGGVCHCGVAWASRSPDLVLSQSSVPAESSLVMFPDLQKVQRTIVVGQDRSHVVEVGSFSCNSRANPLLVILLNV